MTKITIIYPDHIDNYGFIVECEVEGDIEYSESFDTLEEVLELIKERELYHE